MAWPSTSASERPDGPADAPHKKGWTEADKTGFGTARTRKSRVWFTLQAGRVSEVFYPDLSTPSVRSLQLTVDDGTTTDEQGTGMSTVVTRPDERSLRFTQVSTDQEGRYRITQEVVTDPARNAVVLHVRLEALDGGTYTLGVEYDPALGNGGEDDRAQSTDAHPGRRRPRRRRSPARWSASPRSTDARDRKDVDLVQTATFPPRTATTTISLGFGHGRRQGPDGAGGAQPAVGDHRGTPTTPAGTTTSSTLKPVPRARRRPRQYLASALVLAAGEDKAHPGAFIASPSVPWVWGDEIKDLSTLPRRTTRCGRATSTRSAPPSTRSGTWPPRGEP